MHLDSTSKSHALNERVITFGKDIFSSLGERNPSTFNLAFWNGKLMEWSMTKPEFKVNLFRLVDVLPTLASSESISEHVREYLGDAAHAMHPALGWGIGLSKSGVGASLTSFFVKQGVQQMASMFIAGNTPQSALNVLRSLRKKGYAFTVDLLGEFCLCEKEALEYQNRYLDALDVFGSEVPRWSEGSPLIPNHPGERTPVCISVKLSALYSQTSSLNFERSVSILSERLSEVVRRAQKYNAQVYVDAEDTGNNSIIYETFKRVFGCSEFASIPYCGIVIQAYSKGARSRIEEMLEFARRRGAPIAVRLVKGAYWDYENVISSQNDWEFPLWKRKVSSDATYEALSKLLLDNHKLCLPAFGSHNIRSLSHACCYAEDLGLTPRDFEIQLLYGMADPIAEVFTTRGYLSRMYVPLGELLPGMGYLVRRLLENTSNESFLKHTFFDEREVSSLLKEPLMHGDDLSTHSPQQTTSESLPVE